jgi:hypothetical protein
MGMRDRAGQVLVILLAVGAVSVPAPAREPLTAHVYGSPPAAHPRDARPAPAQPRTVTVLGSGDVLLHSGLWRQAQRDAMAAGRSGYDFGPLFAAVRPVVEGVDLAICHLETPLGNPGGPFSGYPVFEVPPQVVPALRSTGYDACSTASNHSLDRGEAGIRRTLDALDAAGVAHSGTHRSAAEKAAPTVVTANGVKVGLLSYTFSFNGLVRPPDRPWLANDLDAGAILAEAGRARAAGGPGGWRVTAAEAVATWMAHDTEPARLVLVPAALADPATPPALREACARSLRRTTTAVTARGAATQGLSITA